MSLFLPAVAAALWFTPFVGDFMQLLDHKIAFYANESLKLNYYWAYFWGIMNMRIETYMNGVLILILNIWYVLNVPKKDRVPAISMVILMWCWIQVGVIFVHAVFFDGLLLYRNSPSLSLEPFLRLSEYLENGGVKDASHRSFPGGHGFAMFYWAFFFTRFIPRRLALVTWAVAIFFCLPRIMSGAHWASDIIFAGMLAYFIVNAMCSTPLYGICMRYVSSFIQTLVFNYKKFKNRAS